MTLVMTSLLIVILFPMGDLSEWVSRYVAEQTQNQVFVDFDDLGFSAAPPGIKLTNVYLEAMQFPGLSSDDMVVSPSLGSVHVALNGIMGGQINATLDPESRGQKTVNKLAVKGDGLRLEDVSKILKKSGQLQMDMKGRLSVVLNGEANEEGALTGDVDLNIAQLNIPSFAVPTQMGDLAIPPLKFNEFKVLGKMSDGRINLDSIKVGNDKDEMFGTVKGTLNVFSQGQAFQVTGYDLGIDLKLKRSLVARQDYKFFVDMIDMFENIGSRYKTDDAEGIRYAFRVQTSNMAAPPRVTPLTN